ncbi:AMP-binding protein [Candidatus Poriferisocius sp.]|uniref:AMP-binding protein n=1 Tax=Candidatus Poriferisocius sp. TaxID=3101276 RepID=UPI003B5CB6E1
MATDASQVEGTLGELLRVRADQLADEPFATCGDDARTYEELDRSANLVASALSANGLLPGDRVATMLPNSLTFLDAWFGIARGGHIHVPVNTSYKKDHLEWVLGLTRSRAIIIDRAFLPALAASVDGLDDLEHVVVVENASSVEPIADLPPGIRRSLRREVWSDWISRSRSRFTAPPASTGDVASILFTSGTTGRSKGVVAPHGHHLHMGATSAAVQRLTSQDTLFTVLPLFHGNAQLTSVVAAMTVGASVAISPRFSATTFWDEIRAAGATQFNLLSTMAHVLLAAPPTEQDRNHNVRVMMGAPVPADILMRFERRFGGHIIEAFGTTELGMIAANPYGDRRPGSFGQPTPGGRIALLDESNAPVPLGEVGEICYRPELPHIMCAGYLDNPEASVEAMRGLWWHTGDLARQDGDGYLYFVDRQRDVIRHKGENVSSFEVEQAILSLAGVEHAAVVAVPAELSEDEILAVVVPSGDREMTAELVFDQCDRRLPHFMVPRYVYVTAEVPTTQTGRVNKAQLVKMDILPRAWDAQVAGRRATRLDRSPGRVTAAGYMPEHQEVG